MSTIIYLINIVSPYIITEMKLNVLYSYTPHPSLMCVYDGAII